MRRFGARAAPVALATALLAAACASAPTAPSVAPLPGIGKSFEQFQADDAVCRQAAAQSAGAGQRRYDVTYVQCMYAKGHQIPVSGSRSSYTSLPATSPPAAAPPANVPPPPSGTPPPPPSGSPR